MGKDKVYIPPVAPAMAYMGCNRQNLTLQPKWKIQFLPIILSFASFPVPGAI
jgi:hypothetical protein